MARARWCESDRCEERALPDTVPPACKKHIGGESEVDERPMCKGKTKFGKPCSYHANSGDPDYFCSSHRKKADGTWHLDQVPNCKYRDIPYNGDRYCSRKARKGYDTCADHIEDPEDRRRERKRQEVEKLVKNDRMRALMMGELDVSELDDEELLRGQFRDKNGNWTGRPAAILPKEVHEKLTAELFRRADGKLTSRIFDVVDTMLEIATNKKESAKDRRAAATWVYERLRGKTPEVLQVQQERPFEIIMTKITAGPRSARTTRGSSALQLEGNVEEAEIVEDEEEADDE